MVVSLILLFSILVLVGDSCVFVDIGHHLHIEAVPTVGGFGFPRGNRTGKTDRNGRDGVASYEAEVSSDERGILALCTSRADAVRSVRCSLRYGSAICGRAEGRRHGGKVVGGGT